MKRFRFLSFLMAVFAAVAISSCGSDDDDEPGLYYVRYTIGVTPGSTAVMSYTDVNGSKTIRQVCNSGTVEVTVGPVKHSFEATVTGNELTDGKYRASQWLRIDVSENGSPFVMKEYHVDALSLSCIIGE